MKKIALSLCPNYVFFYLYFMLLSLFFLLIAVLVVWIIILTLFILSLTKLRLLCWLFWISNFKKSFIVFLDQIVRHIYPFQKKLFTLAMRSTFASIIFREKGIKKSDQMSNNFGFRFLDFPIFERFPALGDINFFLLEVWVRPLKNIFAIWSRSLIYFNLTGSIVQVLCDMLFVNFVSFLDGGFFVKFIIFSNSRHFLISCIQSHLLGYCAFGSVSKRLYFF